MKLFILDEIAVIYDSEQFSRPSARGKPSRERAPFCQFPDDDLVQFFEFPRKLLYLIMLSAIFPESL